MISEEFSRHEIKPVFFPEDQDDMQETKPIQAIKQTAQRQDYSKIISL